jgi:hypothetical protein
MFQISTFAAFRTMIGVLLMVLDRVITIVAVKALAFRMQPDGPSVRGVKMLLAVRHSVALRASSQVTVLRRRFGTGFASVPSAAVSALDFNELARTVGLVPSPL